MLPLINGPARVKLRTRLITGEGSPMDAEALWLLFWTTGLPEAYILRGLLREEEAGQEKSA